MNAQRDLPAAYPGTFDARSPVFRHYLPFCRQGDRDQIRCTGIETDRKELQLWLVPFACPLMARPSGSENPNPKTEICWLARGRTAQNDSCEVTKDSRKRLAPLPFRCALVLWCPGVTLSSAGGMLMYLVDVSVSASVSAAVAAGSLLLRFILLACSAFVRSARNLEEYFRFLENLG